MSLYIYFSLLRLASCSFLCFPFVPLFFCFRSLSPSCLLCDFPSCFFFSSSVFFLSVSFLPPRSVFISCVRLPFASFLALLSSPSCSSFFLSFHLSVATSPFPPTLLCSFPFFFSFLLLFFSSLYPLSIFFSSSSFLSYCPVLLFSPLSLLLLFLLFLVLQLFLFFVFSSSIACFFLSFCYHLLPLRLASSSSSFTSPFSLPLLFFFWFRFPFGY